MSDPAGEPAPRRRSPGAPGDGATGDDLHVRSTRRTSASPSDLGAGRVAGRSTAAGRAGTAGSDDPPPVGGRNPAPRRAAGRGEEPARAGRGEEPARAGRGEEPARAGRSVDREPAAARQRASPPRSATAARRSRDHADSTPAGDGTARDTPERDTPAAPLRRTGRTPAEPVREGPDTERDPEAEPPERSRRSPRGPVEARSESGSSRATEPPVRGPGGRWPMADRSVLATALGMRPTAAVGLAAALTAIGVVVDLTRIGGLGTVFTVCYVSGCVLAVAWVRRSGLFGPVVQPPLLVAVSVPVVVLLAGSPRPGQGVAEQLLVIGAPLVNAFPVMAWTTGIVLVLALLRVLVQRPVGATAISGRSERGAARGAGRKSASPRRS